MGILEIHFHDSQFEWTIGPGASDEQSDTRSESVTGRATTDGGTSPSSAASKLRSVGALILVVGIVFVFNRIRSRRAQKAAEREAEAKRRRLIPWK